ncbi:hypothetical protein D3C86_1098590 [compost metagenome]
MTFFALGGLAIPLVKSLTLRSASPVAFMMLAIDMPPSLSLTAVCSAGIETMLLAAMVQSSMGVSPC